MLLIENSTQSPFAKWTSPPECNSTWPRYELTAWARTGTKYIFVLGEIAFLNIVIPILRLLSDGNSPRQNRSSPFSRVSRFELRLRSLYLTCKGKQRRLHCNQFRRYFYENQVHTNRQGHSFNVYALPIQNLFKSNNVFLSVKFCRKTMNNSNYINRRSKTTPKDIWRNPILEYKKPKNLLTYHTFQPLNRR